MVPRRTFIALVLLAACARHTSTPASGYVRRNPSAHSYALTNGRWFTGTGFESRTFYAVEGILQSVRPAHVDSTVDLAGRWIVPPFGDAHSHSVSYAAGLDDHRRAYIAEGSFYVQVLGNRRSSVAKVRDQVNHPCTVDVTYANAPITSTLGHGFEVYEALALGFRDVWVAVYAESTKIQRSRLGENDGYVFIDSVADVARKWPSILEGKPDIVKITLVGAADTAKDGASLWPARMWFMHGLAPNVIPPIVERAHAAGLRVAAHIETARDFDVAVRAGVDIVAHLMGPEFAPGQEDLYRLRDATAALAAARGVTVIPTVAITNDLLAKDSARLAAVHAIQRANLALLAKHGVRFAVGRDEIGRTAREELLALRALGVWDSAPLLRMWAEWTPQLIFPGRRIGRLADGYEASFLALTANPLEDFDAIGRIALRMKQGCVLE